MRCFLSLLILVMLFSRFLKFCWRLRRRIDYFSNLTNNSIKIGPSMGIFFRENSLPLKAYFKRPDLGIDNILISIGINVFIFCNFERYEMMRYHIAYNLVMWETLSHHFCDWVSMYLHLRKVSWYLDSSWWVHQLWVSQERQYSTYIVYWSLRDLLAIESLLFRCNFKIYSSGK